MNAAKTICDYVAKNYKVNKNKISLCGYSNGASGAWTLLNQNKGYFAAALLVSGHAYNLDGCNPKGLPIIWVTCGTSNDCYGEYKKLSSYLSKAGVNFKSDMVNSTSHSQTKVIALENSINWLISQSLWLLFTVYFKLI